MAKILPAVLETFLHEINRNYDSYKFYCKFAVFLFFLSYKSKRRNKFSASWWSGNRKYFCFLFIMSRALLQRHSQFSRILWRNFFACYSCSYYSSQGFERRRMSVELVCYRTIIAVYKLYDFVCRRHFLMNQPCLNDLFQIMQHGNFQNLMWFLRSENIS